jgi:hypothetical protein
MNGFGEHEHEDAFGPSKGGVMSSFDAFRKSHGYGALDAICHKPSLTNW